jgi:hypothetical protein
MKRLFLIAAAALAIATGADAAESLSPEPILRSLPPGTQKRIESVREGCREQEKYREQERPVTSGDEGLILFTVSGLKAIMVNYIALCDNDGEQGIKWVNMATWGGYYVAIYVRRGGAWKEFEYPVVGKVFLSIDAHDRFKALVLTIKRDKLAPTHDVVVKWDGSKFTHKPL